MRGLMLALLVATACDGGSLGTRDAALPDGGGLDAGIDAFVRDGGFDAGFDAGPPLDCDPGFDASSAVAGTPFEVRFTNATGFAYVGMEAIGPGAPTTELLGIDPGFTWTFRVSGHAEGTLALTFTADEGANRVARCMVRVFPGDEGDAGTDAGFDAGMPPDGGTLPTGNRFGMGFVGEGSEAQYDLTANLTGPGGWVKPIFVGVQPGMSGPKPEWVRVTQWAYDRELIPVVRFAPDWGDRRVRNQADPGSDGLRYTQLAASYVAILRGLPIPAGWPFYVEVHNEPNLCYEWLCDRGRFEGDRITYQRTALEYASMLRDVADAIHALGDDRFKVVNGGLAPGGVRWCECNGTSEAGFEPGITSREFLAAMNEGVPGVFTKIDAFASHAYPASGEGYGFFSSYDASGPGLRYFESELATIGRPSLGVVMTETGWPRSHGGVSYANEDQQAQWTVQAYENVWLTHPNILGIMPFILQDGAWDGFAWVDGAGNGRRVYRDVRTLRCRSIGGRCP